MKVWTCKIGEVGIELPEGADLPMREAVKAAYQKLVGRDPDFIFSGWGGELDHIERAIVQRNKVEIKEEKMAEMPYRCQFCEHESLPVEWKDDKCPKCGERYDVLLAQDSEE